MAPLGSLLLLPVIISHCSITGYVTLPGYYNILYQSFMPNCKLSVKILKRYYRVSDQVITFILGGSNMRICNQRLLTFILTEFEKDYDISRFCVVVEQLIQLPELRRIADKLRNGLFQCVHFIMIMFDSL